MHHLSLTHETSKEKYFSLLTLALNSKWKMLHHVMPGIGKMQR